MNKRKKKVHLSFSTKIIIENILIITLVLVTTGAIVFSFSYNFMYNQEKLLGDEALNKLQAFATQQSNTVFNQYTMIHGSRNISELFTNFLNGSEDPYNLDNIRFIQNYLGNFLTADDSVSEYILVSLHGNVYSDFGSSFRSISPSFDYLNYPLVQKLLHSEDNTIMEYVESPPYIISGQVPTVSYLGKIYDSQQFPSKVVVGFFIMNIPCSEFTNSFSSLHDTLKGDLLLTNKDGEIVYSTNKKMQGTQFETPNTQGSDISKKVVDISGTYAIKVVGQSVLLTDINNLLVSMLPIYFIGIFFTILTTTLLLRAYRRKLNVIAASMSNIQNGDLSVRLPVTHTDEIGQLSETFNNMCEQLTRFITLNYQFETEKKIAEMSALQAQINPHFLYNTIDGVRAEALKHGDESTAEMLVRLANLFRYAADFSENIIFIEDELEYITNYLEMQKIRYKDDFLYDIAVDPSLLYNGMPKLVMQPIVENALIHGLKDQVSKKITINIYKNEELLFIDISDNGCGLPHQKVEEIRHYLNEPDAAGAESFGIGIINVHNRIRILFNGESGLRIESAPNQGTLVRLVFPALGREEMRKCTK